MRVRRIVPVGRSGTSGRTPAPPEPADDVVEEAAPPYDASDLSFVIDNAVYYGGKRIASPPTLADTYALLDKGVGMAWIGLLRPTEEQFATVAAEFGLHELAAEDAVQAHQRPKLERYGDTMFVVLRPARYDDAWEEILFGEVHVFVGPEFVVTVRHGEAPELEGVRKRLEAEPKMLALGPEAVLYAVLDRIVDAYEPVVRGLEMDIDEIEVEVFRGDPGVSKRIYKLSREVIEFQRAAKPLVGVVDALSSGLNKGALESELERYLRDVQDHVLRVVDSLEEMRQLLQNILATNAILVQQQQNDEMKALTEASYDQNEEVKKVSAWAAILFAPTLIGTVYGMNFDEIPELHWAFGYPFALSMMLVVCVVLFLVFRKRGWL